MSEELDDGGQAFPCPVSSAGIGDDVLDGGSLGMSLRDWFAGLAMQAMTASPELMLFVTSGEGLPFERMSRKAYEQADAMIAARRAPVPKYDFHCFTAPGYPARKMSVVVPRESTRVPATPSPSTGGDRE